MRAAHFFFFKRQLLVSLSQYPPATLKRDLASSFFLGPVGLYNRRGHPQLETATSAFRAGLGIKKTPRNSASGVYGELK